MLTKEKEEDWDHELLVTFLSKTDSDTVLPAEI
jgi:hypothetical protein